MDGASPSPCPPMLSRQSSRKSSCFVGTVANLVASDPSSPRTGSLLAERYRTEMKPYAFAGKAHLDHASPQWQGTYSWSREVGASQPGSASTPATPPSDYVHSSSSGPSSSRHARKGKVKVGKPTHHFHVDGSGQASSSRAGGGGGGQHGTSHHHSSHHHQHHPHPHHHHSHGHSSSRKYRSKRHKDEAGCCAIL